MTLITSPQPELGDTYPVVPVEESPDPSTAASARCDQAAVSGRVFAAAVLLAALVAEPAPPLRRRGAQPLACSGQLTEMGLAQVE
ncbi:MAG TPA: hypothetical protein VHH91_05210 [Vicinamibacterales bacterium]|nr:hypothetical protein [Vicinamibacterales bacterium]